MFKFRSVKSIVIAPANTGKDKRSKIAVIKTAQGNKGIRSRDILSVRRFAKVLIKLTAPKSEEIPAKCKEKIVKSTLIPECPKVVLKGGYTVQPVPAPTSTILPTKSKIKAGIRNQNLILLSRGNAMSGAPNIRGTNQFPNPPIKAGITIKKIIINA